MKIPVKIMRIKPMCGVPPDIPRYMTPGAACVDLNACLDEPMIVKPGEICSIPTGIAIEIQSLEYAAFIYARSGLSLKHGLSLVNGVGVIDSDYRGEIKAALINLSDCDYTISQGERVAQMGFMPICHAIFTEVESLNDTVRSCGGFGSTGKR